MSAVAEQIRTYDYYERRGLEAELHRWGRWIVKREEYNAFPNCSNTEAARVGNGGGIPEHRILCLDMPTDVYATHMRIWTALTGEERDVIYVRYAFKVNEDGSISDRRIMCQQIGLSPEAFRKRLQRAKTKILGLPT